MGNELGNINKITKILTEPLWGLKLHLLALLYFPNICFRIEKIKQYYFL